MTSASYPAITPEEWAQFVDAHGDRLAVVEWADAGICLVLGPVARDKYAAHFDALAAAQRGDGSQLVAAEHNLVLESAVWPARGVVTQALAEYPRLREQAAPVAIFGAMPTSVVELVQKDGAWQTEAGDAVASEVLAVVDGAAKGRKVAAFLVDGAPVVFGPARSSRYGEARSAAVRGDVYASAELYASGGLLYPDAPAWKALVERFPSVATIAGNAVRDLGSPGEARVGKAPSFSTRS